MHCISQENVNLVQFKRRLIALSILLCFVFAPMLATVFIITQTSHVCIEECCSVCVIIHNAQELLERIGKAAVTILIAVVGLLAVAAVRTKLDFFEGCPSTLISVKIRMNN